MKFIKFIQLALVVSLFTFGSQASASKDLMKKLEKIQFDESNSFYEKEVLIIDLLKMIDFEIRCAQASQEAFKDLTEEYTLALEQLVEDKSLTVRSYRTPKCREKTSSSASVRSGGYKKREFTSRKSREIPGKIDLRCAYYCSAEINYVRDN